ncbi:hypothetical protein [Parapedobacter sp. 2B3]|uniref:hypothetical protein n=1 Tax=Parapedobacter sp. 2B3 TaxID=3342381 RepID=UPI0035B604B2
MRNAAFITLLISGIAFSAVAQERAPRVSKSAEEIAQMRTDRLTEQLSLTENQQQAVYALSLENAKKMQATHEERAARLAEMQKAKAAKMDEQRAEMKASQERLNEILTSEQQALLKQQQAERAAKMKSMRETHKDGKYKGGRSGKSKHGFHKSHKKTDSARTTVPEETK